jgi:hypothetical protein
MHIAVCSAVPLDSAGAHDYPYVLLSNVASRVIVQPFWEREDGKRKDGDLVKLFDKIPRDQVLFCAAVRFDAAADSLPVFNF